MQRICDAAAKSDMRILVASIKDADDMAKLAEQGKAPSFPGISRMWVLMPSITQCVMTNGSHVLWTQSYATEVLCCFPHLQNDYVGLRC
jgi:hypothetical protein